MTPTPTVNNEAASRLRDSMYDLAVTPDREAFLVDLDAALAAERRGTVERVRARLFDHPAVIPDYDKEGDYRCGCEWGHFDISAILDEEASS